MLLLSLWATAALAAVGIAQATRISLELKWAGRLQEQRQSWFLSWTALEVAAQLLSQDPEFAWDAPKELWAQAPQEPVPFEGGTFRYLITDEQARIPLNTAQVETLQRLPGFTPEAANQMLLLREEGRTFAHLGELPSLPGFQTELLSQLEPMATLLPTGSVNIHTASAQALAALGLSAGLADQIVVYRNGQDGQAGTADDAFFPEEGGVIDALELALGTRVPEPDRGLLGELISSGVLGIRSAFFRVAMEGWSARHQVQEQVEAVVERGGQGEALKVRGWHEDT